MIEHVETVVAPPLICGCASVALAHRLMREHRECRVDRCAWKLAAYHTLVVFGRIKPQTLSPRERAAERGIPFPASGDDRALQESSPSPLTFRQVLDALNRLALPPEQEVGRRSKGRDR
ncbi:hypothetical protein [Nocardia abscessus]|uniref:hypothetical protein n=1 Tax=Nocardia abscessus TaxID=120957 RepID=UPI0024554612|nr:hypothetical protein [Nocardia abscessus]